MSQQQALSAPPSPSPQPQPASRGRFAPLGLAVVLVVAVSIGLMAWSRQGWSTLQSGGYALQQQIARLQVQMLELQNPADTSPARQLGTLQDAIAASDHMVRDGGEDARLSDGPPCQITGRPITPAEPDRKSVV